VSPRFLFPSLEVVIVLHNIRSIHNVASIFRTADAAGVGKVYLCGITPSPIDRFGKPRPDFVKVSLGAEKHIVWGKAGSIARLFVRLKEDDFYIAAIEQHRSAISYSRFHPSVGGPDSKFKTLKLALVFGNEVKGLPPSVLRRADKVLEIPIRGKTVRCAYHPKNGPGRSRGKESLNVSVAVGIVAYFFLCQR